MGHCWEYHHTVEDTDEDGDFDGVCLDEFQLELDDVPLPPSGVFTGEHCMLQSAHESMKWIIANVNAGTPPAPPRKSSTKPTSMSTCSRSRMVRRATSPYARNACLAYLETETACDLEHMDGWNAAVDLCNAEVMSPMAAAMTDVSGCAGWTPPHKTLDGFAQGQDGCDSFEFEDFENGSLEGPAPCEEGDEGDDVDVTGEAPFGGSNRFGDIKSLVDCPSPNDCELEPELLVNVSENFHVFHDEGVMLEMVAAGGGHRAGAQISGLDWGENAEELMTAVGIENDDIVVRVNGVWLTSVANVLGVINDLASAGAWDVSIQRFNGSSWTAIHYEVTLAF